MRHTIQTTHRLIVILSLALASCGPAADSAKTASAATETAPRLHVPKETPIPMPVTSAALPYRVPALHSSWQIQYSGNIDTSLNVDVYNLDLFNTDTTVISDLHARGVFVMCYFSAGSFENWRPDVSAFPTGVLGKPLPGWDGENWLDIRNSNTLRPIMEARLDLAAKKKCDGVDPDNVDGYKNDTGFPLSGKDQLAYNIFLSETAHARGLSVGLKNDLDQISALVSYFDWALNEECFMYKECAALAAFISAGKPIFNIEYKLNVSDFCPDAIKQGFNSLRKNINLDAFRQTCK